MVQGITAAHHVVVHHTSKRRITDIKVINPAENGTVDYELTRKLPPGPRKTTQNVEGWLNVSVLSSSEETRLVAKLLVRGHTCTIYQLINQPMSDN